jgi:hypothetical protein
MINSPPSVGKEEKHALEANHAHLVGIQQDWETMTEYNQTAVIYARSASADSAAILSQILECAKIASEQGMLIAGIYHDNGCGSNCACPDFQKMMVFLRDWREGKIVVLMANPSRISRNFERLQDVHAEFEELGVQCLAPYPLGQIFERNILARYIAALSK